ncbi:MAG TPA: hypothetical protein VGI66_08685 [Streptosporangiaceae bacterium]|jgi:hypothetical protein
MALASVAAVGLAAALSAAPAEAAHAGRAQVGRSLLVASALPNALHPLPNVGNNAYLGGVWCETATSCWAVGGYGKANGAIVNQALYWNGRKWSLTHAANPAGTRPADNNLLTNVSCASRQTCWAVGEEFGYSGPVVAEALRWTGTRWSAVHIPRPVGLAHDGVYLLSGISCPAPGECWAVGGYVNGQHGVNQILRWNGTRWSEVPVPNPGGSASSAFSGLSAVTCASTRNCWAVGGYSVLHPRRVGRSQALHWNGRRWALVATPQLGGATNVSNFLASASCIAPDNCWAVGDYLTAFATGASRSQTLHWNGTKWSAVSVPQPDGTGRGSVNSLTAVSCTSASNCWAAGYYGGLRTATAVGRNQTVHWNGKKWALMPSPDPIGTAHGDDNLLSGISCAAEASCWAVGTGVPKTGISRDQALRWNGITWSGYR